MSNNMTNITDDLKYILEQAKIEIEQTRSWPTKIMAFYVAINFGLIGSLIALKKDDILPAVPCWVKNVTTVLVLWLSCWVVLLLWKNHKNYLTYRNVQIRFQNKNIIGLKGEYELPDDWFKLNKIRPWRRSLGWGFYFYIVLMITMLTIAGIWIIPKNT